MQSPICLKFSWNYSPGILLFLPPPSPDTSKGIRTKFNVPVLPPVPRWDSSSSSEWRYLSEEGVWRGGVTAGLLWNLRNLLCASDEKRFTCARALQLQKHRRSGSNAAKNQLQALHDGIYCRNSSRWACFKKKHQQFKEFRTLGGHQFNSFLCLYAGKEKWWWIISEWRHSGCWETVLFTFICK